MVDLGYGRGWLNADAAASLWRVDSRIGHPLQITSAGRTRAEQQAAYDRYLAGTGSFAAYPGTSPHEFGNAIDTNERLVDILADHGWWRPLSFEPWHFVYRAHADNHINEGSTSGGSFAEEDDMTDAQEAKLDAILHALGANGLVAGGWSDTIVGNTREIKDALSKIGTRVVNLDMQVTGADGFTPNLVEHVLDVRRVVDGLGVSGGQIDVDELARKLREGLAPEIIKALSVALAG